MYVGVATACMYVGVFKANASEVATNGNAGQNKSSAAVAVDTFDITMAYKYIAKLTAAASDFVARMLPGGGKGGRRHLLNDETGRHAVGEASCMGKAALVTVAFSLGSSGWCAQCAEG